MLLSLIVPVFNIANYLPRCIDSILSQTFTDFEIILVDDGSSDSSSRICDLYAQKDHRIRVIHKKNGGLSDARNFGLLSAKGDYLFFIDGDDFLSDNTSLHLLATKLKKLEYPDVLGFNFYHYYPNKIFKKNTSISPQIEEEFDKDKLIALLTKTGSLPVSACTKLVRRTLLLEKNIVFPLGTISEDIVWFFDLYSKCTSIRFVNNYVYCYRKARKGSITNSFSQKKYNDLFKIIDQLATQVKEKMPLREYEQAQLAFCAYYYFILLGELKNFSYSQRIVKKRELLSLEWVLSERSNPKVYLIYTIYTILGFNLTSWLCHYYIEFVVRRK